MTRGYNDNIVQQNNQKYVCISHIQGIVIFIIKPSNANIMITIIYLQICVCDIVLTKNTRNNYVSYQFLAFCNALGKYFEFEWNKTRIY